MPTFTYTAVSREGKSIKGREQATDEQELSRLLREKGYIVTSTAEEGEAKSLFSRDIPIPLLSGVSLTDKLMFARNLKVMVSAGVSLPKALGILAEQTENRKFRKALLDIQEHVVKGETLSSSMALYSDIFSELFVNMVKVGEEAGTLEQTLDRLATQLEREYELKSKIQGAMMYPAVVITAMLGIGVLMLVMVVPQLAKQFEELGVKLPLTTRLVIGFADFLTERWYLAIGIAILFAASVMWASKRKKGKEILDAVFLRAPVISGIVRKTQVALIARTLSSLIGAGVPLLQGLNITGNAIGIHQFKQSLQHAEEQVRKGTRLSDALELNRELYPVVFLQMVRIGEETGETETILAKLADFFEEEVTTLTKNLASIVEPILMLIIGAAIGFFAVSMIQPMYSIIQTVSP